MQTVFRYAVLTSGNFSLGNTYIVMHLCIVERKKIKSPVTNQNVRSSQYKKYKKQYS
jgi:hypothetical protein